MAKKSKDTPASKWEKFANQQSEVKSEDPQEQAEVDVEQQEEPAVAHERSQSEVESDLDEGLQLDVGDALAQMNQVEELQNRITAMELEVATYHDKAARAAAEMENMDRRVKREVKDARLYANSKLITALLPVMDSLVRGQEGVDINDPQLKSMLDGLVLTQDMLEKALLKFGLEVIHPEKGEAFNPEKHEAMSMQSDPDAEKNTVLQLLQKGYELNGRVLRAAMVIVAQ